ncbi:hypothetical protein [Spirosoma sp.]|uniref:hypothetical protein n=1 Tax=Spirosoma sp. TaxID=1899569 RepID=UPI00261063A1|nr:hypothetical protein [Spirosoma sp.]MCX6216531.1 hypothetical protein [Spirosoma sp.]
MCSCISELQKPVLYKHPKGKLVTAVDLPLGLVWGKESNQLRAMTFTEARISVEGKKTPERFKLQHTYCPFCGVKYGEESPVKSSENPLPDHVDA